MASEHVARAVALERAGRWSEAAMAWRAARDAMGEKLAEEALAARGAAARGGAAASPRAAAEVVRAKTSGLVVGAVLRHGTCECTYAGPRDFRFAGMSYSSLSSAATAAAVALGHKSRALNGWKFWGVERREGRRDDLRNVKDDEDDDLQGAEAARQGEKDNGKSDGD